MTKNEYLLLSLKMSVGVDRVGIRGHHKWQQGNTDNGLCKMTHFALMVDLELSAHSTKWHFQPVNHDSEQWLWLAVALYPH